MVDWLLTILLNVLVCLTMIGGLFFLFTGAVGIARLPDFYSRNHASSKCITLGIAGMLLALVLYIGVGTTAPASQSQAELQEASSAEMSAQEPVIAAATKAVLVIAFIFVGAPVGSHMLARAAHLAGVKAWEGTLSDELADDRQASSDEFPEHPDGTSPVPAEREGSHKDADGYAT